MVRDSVLLERERELAWISELLDAAEGQRGAVGIVEGAAGIGKTRLLSAAGGLAGRRGFTVLRACGGELECGFAYGVVRQLFESRLRAASAQERAALLEGAAGWALPVLGLDPAVETGGKSEAEARFAIQHGLYWLVDNLTAAGPVLICVDDVHWADAASLAWLIYLVRRLEGMAVTVLLGCRVGESGSREMLLESLRAEPAVQILGLSGLSVQATEVLLRAAMDQDFNPAFVRVCHEVSGGNPFLLGELATAVVEEQIPPTAEAAHRVRNLGPATVARSVLLRLGRLPPEARELAQAVAVLDTDAALGWAAVVAGLTGPAARQAAAGLQQAGIFAPGHPLAFSHPILRAAVYENLPQAQRADAHGKAARVLAASGSRVDRAAVHLLSVPPEGDSWVVECLRTAASSALARGEADVAASLLARALAEPPPNSARPMLTLELGRAERLAGRPGAITRLREALQLASGSAEREEAARELAGALAASSHPGEAIEILEAEIARLPAAEQERALRLEAELLVVAAYIDMRAPRLLARISRFRQDITGATPTERVVLSAVITYRLRRADTAAPELCRGWTAAWGQGQLLTEQGPASLAIAWIIVGLARLDEVDTAREMAEQTIIAGQVLGSAAGVALGTLQRAFIQFLAGELAAAETNARTALHTSELTGHTVAVGCALSVLIHVLIDCGEVSSASQTLEEHGLTSGDPPPSIAANWLLAARCRLRLVQGRTTEAIADIDAYFRLLAARGSRGYPTGVRLIGAEAYRLQDDYDQARMLVAEELELARRMEISSVIGMALRAQARLEDGPRRRELLRESVTVLQDSPRRLELAYSLVELGAQLRRDRARIQAREPLRRGLELAQRCGATPLRERAHAELLATGARPRRMVLSGAEALTATERRVAEMAVSGKSNREIAQALFVTRKTIEAHLGAAYRKLGITSRDDLTPALR
jgi:DNA-binding CsgD family transcriptional regulator